MNDLNQLDNFFMGPPRDRGGRSGKRWLAWLARIRDFFPTKEQFFYLPRVLSQKERFVISGLLVIALGSLVAIPISAHYQDTVAAADYVGSWSEAVVGSPQHINPLLLQANDADSDLTNLVFAGLMRYDRGGKLVPDLAESYTVSDDGLLYTFKLKPNLRWHDGQELTADDVLFTIITAQNADYGSPQRVNWQGVDVTKQDDSTITFRLKNRYAQFLSNATLGILPRHLWENTKATNFSLSENNLKPVGAGPYKFSNIKRDTLGNIRSLELISFDKYAGGRPYIERIAFRFYDSEQAAVDGYNKGKTEGLSSVSALQLDTLRLKKKLSIVHFKLPRYFGVFFNQNRSQALADKNVRLALNHATDKQAILKGALNGNGLAVDSPLLPGIIDIPSASCVYAFDPEKANALLDKAGWKYEQDSKVRTKEVKSSDNKTTQKAKLEISITTSSWPELVAVANILKTQWESVGASVAITNLSVPEVQQAIKERDYDALLFGEVLGLDPDPFSFWHSSQKKDPGLNLALYDDREADKILEDARQIMDPAMRQARYSQLQKIIIDDAPVVFLYSPDYLYILPKKIHRDNGSGILAMPAHRFDTVHEWYIDTRRTAKGSAPSTLRSAGEQ